MTNDLPAVFHLRERVRVLLRLAQSATDITVRAQVMTLVERLRARADELDAPGHQGPLTRPSSEDC